ncbi:ankyrin repeat domain-containing protein [Wolbachia endosymbiont (group A) of Agelastica alni]|uniref:ankyrin repeat domain-containing protein n=1 Tax=Wolbachia endosymbiont (group A) of Agelastica alni TaxID=3066130 RepID=UPI003341ED60
MAIEKEKFFEIIRNVSESEGLNKDNLLERIRNELRNKDYAEYDKFNRGFSKEHQFSIKISDKIEDWTLLHLAAACNNLLTVTLLLEKKVSVKTRVKDGSNDGPTAFDIATSNSNQEIVQLLRKANPQLEKNKDKTSRDIIIKTNKTPEGLVVNGNNAAAAPANVISPYLKQHDATRNDKQTSVTGESSDSTADKQRQSVKDMIKNFELPQRRNTTCSGKQTSTSLNESGNSDDSGICTESEDGEDTDAKNEELKKLEKELTELRSFATMLVVGAALSIAFGLSALLIVAASVVSALIAGGITYEMSKPSAEPKPATELKEVDIQGSAQHSVCKA